MAFRTNKVPAIEERTVSGSSVSFNSAFALPLKACKVSFMATQSGSGTPSPSNPRPISGFSQISVSANGTTHIVQLGDTYYGGYFDAGSGKFVATHRINRISDLTNWSIQVTANGNQFFKSFPDRKPNAEITTMLSNMFQYQNPWSPYTFYIGASSNITFRINLDATLTDWNSFLANNVVDICYELVTPIEIQLSSLLLEAVEGQNTFSTDTGTLEITFADLQEKSASGSVATFNTALSMPLVNGEFTIQAYQEGSGDPAPDNVRNIVPRREVNIENYGGNDLLVGMTYEINKYINAGGVITNSAAWSVSDYIEVTPSVDYVALKLATGGSGAYCAAYKSDKTFSRTFEIVANQPTYMSLQADEYFIRVSVRSLLPEQFGSKLYLDNQYLVNLGEDVYGAVINTVDGGKKITWGHIILDETVEPNFVNWRPNESSVAWTYPPSVANSKKYGGNVMPNVISDKYKTVTYYTFYSGTIDEISVHSDANYGLIVRSTNTSLTTKSAILAYLADNPIDVIYELDESIDGTPVTPTPINTFNGDNNIYCDTGDTSLTYKDLDIAKRGNFREVFKLPS